MIRTFILILVLVASITWLLIISVNQNRTSQPQPTATPSPAQSVLTLSDEGLSTSSARTVNVNIDTGNNKVTGVQIELSYDPKVLTNVNIKPGTFFENPVTLLKEINTKEGTISLALGVSPGLGGIYGTGTAAILTFNTASDSGETTISFNPKTLVSGEGIAESILKSATGLTLDLSK